VAGLPAERCAQPAEVSLTVTAALVTLLVGGNAFQGAALAGLRC
jgi:hypothetical protein